MTYYYCCNLTLWCVYPPQVPFVLPQTVPGVRIVSLPLPHIHHFLFPPHQHIRRRR